MWRSGCLSGCWCYRTWRRQWRNSLWKSLFLFRNFQTCTSWSTRKRLFRNNKIIKMEKQFLEYIQYICLLSPVLMGWLQSIKSTYPQTKRFIPIIGIFLWIWCLFLVNGLFWFDLSIKANIFVWIMLWLASTGFYEAWKNFIPKK